MDKILHTLAKQNGVTVEEVYREIQISIKSGQSNPDPCVQSYWQKISSGNMELPTVEKSDNFF